MAKSQTNDFFFVARPPTFLFGYSNGRTSLQFFEDSPITVESIRFYKLDLGEFIWKSKQATRNEFAHKTPQYL